MFVPARLAKRPAFARHQIRLGSQVMVLMCLVWGVGLSRSEPLDAAASDAQHATDKSECGSGDGTTQLTAAADWHLLLPDPDDPIKAVTVEIPRKRLLWVDERILPMKATITNRATLGRIETGLCFPLRYAVPDDGTFGGFVGNGFVFGKMEVSTADREFVIGICRVGFVMNDTQGTLNNLFYSYRLAKELDATYFNETERHLPKELFKWLSGIRKLEEQGWKPSQEGG